VKILLTGATGYVGSQLLPALIEAGHSVRCTSRRPLTDLPAGAEGVQADALTGEGLAEALDGIEVAYYLVHSMEGGGDFAARDRTAASNFARAAGKAGVRRIVYLGGLGGDSDSEHLQSRQETAQLLADATPEFVHARAAVVIGSGSASFVMLKDLVERLPAMICPRWIDVKTQPIATSDIVAALLHCGEQAGISGDVQLGGGDVVTYRQMILSLAEALGRRAPLIVKVPVLTPRLSSHWVGLVTGVDAGIAKPLIHGLRTETIVTDPPPPGINDNPLGIKAAMAEALGDA